MTKEVLTHLNDLITSLYNEEIKYRKESVVAFENKNLNLVELLDTKINKIADYRKILYKIQNDFDSFYDMSIIELPYQ